MIILKNSEMKEIIYNNIRATMTKERTGIHLSDLIYCIRKPYFRKMGLSSLPSNELCVLWMTGYAFQAYMFPLDEEITIQVDGINCTPDILSGIEVKSTRQSSRKFSLEDMGHWKRQILGYCKALNKLEYDLVVLFLMGNYAPPFPDIDCWHIGTTVEEVEDNWQEILTKRNILEEALKIGIPPEPDCEDWEWSYCENIGMCPDTVCWRKMELKGRKK